jgi:hypothetical protein
MCFHFSKHVLSDIRYHQTCALTSDFVLGVGRGRLPWKLSKILTVDCCKRVLLSPLFDFDFGDMLVLCLKTLYPKLAENKIEKVRKKDTFPAIR